MLVKLIFLLFFFLKEFSFVLLVLIYIHQEKNSHFQLLRYWYRNTWAKSWLFYHISVCRLLKQQIIKIIFVICFPPVSARCSCLGTVNQYIIHPQHGRYSRRILLSVAYDNNSRLDFHLFENWCYANVKALEHYWIVLQTTYNLCAPS